MKQTAVEWFAKELNNWRIKEFGEDSIIGIPQEVFDKAKEIEKEQIIEAHSDGRKRQVDNGEQYYEQTFKSE